MTDADSTDAIVRVAAIAPGALAAVLDPHGLEVMLIGPAEPIPGCYWGEPEAGLLGNRLYLRPDTPVHSALHEAAHFICMDSRRRRSLDRDAGGDFAEENAVCYLQILLADEVPGLDRDRMCRDMDAWGYTFRLGSARRWFEEDADDAREWLKRRGLLTAGGDADYTEPPARRIGATMKTPLKIEIVSDHVCPWCYIGKRRLEKALGQRPEIAAEITWLPFQLSPDMPREGKDRREHYAAIFGEERARAIIEKMSATAAADGLAFEVKPGARSPNTMAAHVLMHWAGHTPGIDQNALAEKLFAAHHTRSEDIGDPTVLARIAGEVGMDSAEVLRKLEAGTDEEQVRTLMEQARSAGVTGVPFFIFNRKYALSGAQPPEAIVELIDEIAAEAG